MTVSDQEVTEALNTFPPYSHYSDIHVTDPILNLYIYIYVYISHTLHPETLLKPSLTCFTASAHLLLDSSFLSGAPTQAIHAQPLALQPMHMPLVHKRQQYRLLVAPHLLTPVQGFPDLPHSQGTPALGFSVVIWGSNLWWLIHCPQHRSISTVHKQAWCPQPPFVLEVACNSPELRRDMTRH